MSGCARCFFLSSNVSSLSRKLEDDAEWQDVATLRGAIQPHETLGNHRCQALPRFASGKAMHSEVMVSNKRGKGKAFNLIDFCQ